MYCVKICVDNVPIVHLIWAWLSKNNLDSDFILLNEIYGYIKLVPDLMLGCTHMIPHGISHNNEVSAFFISPNRKLNSER